MIEDSKSRNRSNHRDITLALLLLVLTILAHLYLLYARGTASVVGGDEGTFLSMIESLALDGDLVFSEPDLDRLEAAAQPGRKAVILQEFGERIAYSKPVVYPLLAAPAYRIAGVAGVVGLNIAALAMALLLAWSALVRFGFDRPATLVVTFAGTSVLMGYTAWTMSDSLQASMTLAGLALGLGGAREAAGLGAGVSGPEHGTAPRVLLRLFDRPWAPYVGVALIALVAGMRLPNLALAGAPVLAWLFRGRFARAFLLSVAVVLVAGSAFALNRGLAGALMPYKTVRATFNPVSGYPVGPQEQEARQQFSDKVALATQVIGVRPAWDPEVSAYSAFYFLVGRHTGLLWYFPLASLLLVAGLRRPDAVSWSVLLTVFALAVFYLVWMPRNYFGGATFLGNRYFLTGFMGLLFLPRRSLPRSGLGIAWLVGLTVFGSACLSIERTADLERSSQTHAYAGLFRLLPYEATAKDIDGRRDVYWTDEFFRFEDPFAIVDPTGFSLREGDPFAEVLHANRREAALVRFLARSDAPGGRIRYRGAGREQTFELEPIEGGSWGLVEIELQETSRRHRYWFDKEARLHTRTHRLRFEQSAAPPDGRRRSAELHYLGSMRLVPKFFRGMTMAVELPERVAPGAASRIPIRVRNTGMRFWSSTEMVPTRLGYRIYRLPRGEGDPPIRGRLQDFDGRVPRASELVADLDVSWPTRPGRYELVIDLNLGGAVWYGVWNQAPLARAEVVVGSETGESSVGGNPREESRPVVGFASP